ncbi:MAG: D-alanine--D-alanine ligase [Acidobacteriota bacterium]
MRIGLVYDLRDDYLAEGWTPEEAAEFDSVSTIDALDNALRSLGHEVERIGHGRRLCARVAAGSRWDLVFNIAEGRRGRSREAQVPALLELYDIPYTFSDPLVCAATLDKAVGKRLVRDAGLRTPEFAVIRALEETSAIELEFPLFAKPLAEGTGKWIDSASRVDDMASLTRVCAVLLARSGQPVLVEEYLPGREFTTGIAGTGRRARVIGTMEIFIHEAAGTSDYSFEVKQDWEKLCQYPPLEVGGLRDEVEALALEAYRALECRDLGRVDLRLDRQGRPSFVEVNPLPGLNPVYSDLPILSRQNGWEYVDIIRAVIESALERCNGGPH